MHFYWRIKEELAYLGEVLIFHDPSLVREYRRWVKKNAIVLAYMRKGPDSKPRRAREISPSLN
jgi:hypothetical protein